MEQGREKIFHLSYFKYTLTSFFYGKTVLGLHIIKNAVVNIQLVYSKSVKKLITKRYFCVGRF